MDLYAIGMVPLLDYTSHNFTECKQVAYADDNNGGGKLENLKQWWDKVSEDGPKYGYLPEPSKSWLITKPDKEELAKDIFQSTNVTDTSIWVQHCDHRTIMTDMSQKR